MASGTFRKVHAADGTVFFLSDSDLAASSTYSGLGLVAAPATSVSSGTPSSGSSEVRDTTIGIFQWTASASRRYRVTLAGNVVNGTAAADLGRVIIRDGGSATPTSASTAISGTQFYILGNGGPFQTQNGNLTNTFTTTAGLHTLSVFTQRQDGTGVVTLLLAPNATARELYVEDIGHA